MDELGLSKDLDNESDVQEKTKTESFDDPGKNARRRLFFSQNEQ